MLVVLVEFVCKLRNVMVLPEMETKAKYNMQKNKIILIN